MGKVLASIVVLTAFILNAAVPQSTKIIDTIPIVPDAVTLAAAEVRETRNFDKDTSDSTIQLSYEEAQCLMKIAYSEAGNQGIKGQQLIMDVVYNRVLGEDFPDTIFEVITQDGQFESYNNGSYDLAEPIAETHLALAAFEGGQDRNTEIIAFETTSNKKSLERYADYSFTYLDHDFFVRKHTNK